MIGIYKIVNKLNQRVYIGQSKDIKNRWMRHKSCLNNNSHENKYLQNAWNKYGEGNFEFIVIEECLLEDLDSKEKFWISEYDSMNNGYNLAEGGNGCRGYKHSKDEIEKMRNAHCSRKVVQLDLKMNYIKTWCSAGTAAKALGHKSASGILRCCEKDKYKKAYNYIWVYEDDYLSGNIDYEYYLKENKSKPKKVSQYDINMNLVKIWNSAYEIKKELGYSNAQISECCNKKRKTAYNFIWRFTDEYTQEQYEEDLEKDLSDPKSYYKRKVNKYSLSDQLIETYPSISDAARQNNLKSISSITRCCCGEYKTAAGFKWKYAS